MSCGFDTGGASPSPTGAAPPARFPLTYRFGMSCGFICLLLREKVSSRLGEANVALTDEESITQRNTSSVPCGDTFPHWGRLLYRPVFAYVADADGAWNGRSMTASSTELAKLTRTNSALRGLRHRPFSALRKNTARASSQRTDCIGRHFSYLRMSEISQERAVQILSRT